MGRCIDQIRGEETDPGNSYWVYPIFAQHPTAVRDQLIEAGFDATCQARMSVIQPADESRDVDTANFWWKHVVFLPWYVELTDQAIEQMGQLLKSVELLEELP